jgi:hypothetical protein
MTCEDSNTQKNDPSCISESQHAATLHKKQNYEHVSFAL